MYHSVMFAFLSAASLSRNDFSYFVSNSSNSTRPLNIHRVAFAPVPVFISLSFRFQELKGEADTPTRVCYHKKKQFRQMDRYQVNTPT